MKVLFVLEFGTNVPSGLVRSKIYEKLFSDKKVYVKFISRYPEGLHRTIRDQKSRSFTAKVLRIVLIAMQEVAVCYQSLRILVISKTFTVIWLNKVLSAPLINLLRFVYPDKKIIIDIVDSPYENNAKWCNAISKLSAITTDNQYNHDFLKEYNSCSIIPDYPQLDKFDEKRASFLKSNENIIIGWIGTDSTFFNVEPILDQLISLGEEQSNISFVFLGAPAGHPKISNNKKFKIVPSYDQGIMTTEVLKMNIGLFPLDNSIGSLVRGVLKATIYMSGGAIVVASPIGEVNDLITDGCNGILVHDYQDWKEKLQTIVAGISTYGGIGDNGLAYVRKNYSLESNFLKMYKLIQ